MSRQTFRYQPALDGVRALAVAAVLLFHGGISWMSGGYLGVSVFFTLSGFLITSLLLVEHERHGRISARAFYARRARRLLPASFLCLAGVCVMAWLGWFRGVANIRRDVLAALFQVFNWVKLGSGESYADLTTINSGFRKPLEHYWSLAIEEQFYWIWPLLFVGLVALARRWRRHPLVPVAALTALAAIAAPVIARVWGPDAAYWATPARAAEILAGALLACVLAGRVPSARWAGAAPLALIALVAACVLFPTGHGPAYQGAMPLVAAVSALLILGLQVEGPVQRLLSARPLVAVGKVSYGVYLYHWPVFVLIDRHAWHVPVGVVLALKLGITAALATASYLWVERPVRTAPSLVPRRTLVLALGGTAIIGASVLMVPVVHDYYGIDQALAAQAGIGTGPVAPLVPVAPATTVTTTVTGSSAVTTSAVATSAVATSAVSASTVPLVPARPVRIVVVGDSTAHATGNGLVQWAAAHPALAQVDVVTQAGCGVVTGGFRQFGDVTYDIDAQCHFYLAKILPRQVLALHPDVVMVLTTTWDVVDRQLVRGGPWLRPTDPAMRAAARASFAALTDQLLFMGASRVVWVDEPIPVERLLGPTDHEGERARHQVLYDIMDSLADHNPAVRVADLDGWVTAHHLTDDTTARPDAVHWTPDASLRIADTFLGPLLVREALT